MNEWLKGDIHKNSHSSKIDSPGLKSAKQNVKGVQRRIKMFEKVAADDATEAKVVVNRLKVKISPQKIKRRKKSAEIDKIKSQYDKKPLVIDKMLKSNDKMNLVKAFLKENEESTDDKEVPENENTDTCEKILKIEGGLERKNVYDILMNSVKEGSLTPKPRKYQRKRLIAMTPKHVNQKSMVANHSGLRIVIMVL